MCMYFQKYFFSPFHPLQTKIPQTWGGESSSFPSISCMFFVSHGRLILVLPVWAFSFSVLWHVDRQCKGQFPPGKLCACVRVRAHTRTCVCVQAILVGVCMRSGLSRTVSFSLRSRSAEARATCTRISVKLRWELHWDRMGLHTEVTQMKEHTHTLTYMYIGQVYWKHYNKSLLLETLKSWKRWWNK